MDTFQFYIHSCLSAAKNVKRRGVCHSVLPHDAEPLHSYQDYSTVRASLCLSLVMRQLCILILSFQHVMLHRIISTSSSYSKCSPEEAFDALLGIVR